MTQAYPLQWPEQFPRTTRRERSRFNTSLSGSLSRVQDSLRLFAKDSNKTITGVVISSNYALGQISNGTDYRSAFLSTAISSWKII